MENNAIIETRAEQLAVKIETLISESRQKVASVVNTAQVYTYFEIGRYIVEDEQGGKTRAEYGKGILKCVSERLTERFGKGWSEENLRQMRKFFISYSGNLSKVDGCVPKTQDSVLEIECREIQATGLEISSITENANQWLANFKLPWSHYIILMHEKNPQARSFYEIEAYNQQWSKRQLQRQIYLTYPQLSNNIGTFLLKLPIGQSLISQLQLPDNQEDTIGQSLIAQSNTIRRTPNVQFVGVAPDKHLFQSTNLISLQRNAWQSSCVRRMKD